MSNNPALRHSDAGGPAGAIVFVHGSLSSRRIWAPYSAAFGTRETIAMTSPVMATRPPGLKACRIG